MEQLTFKEWKKRVMDKVDHRLVEISMDHANQEFRTFIHQQIDEDPETVAIELSTMYEAGIKPESAASELIEFIQK